MGDYTAQHWIDVGRILEEAAEEAKFQGRLVSDGNSSGIILQDIVSNLFQDEIVICDVSGRNPNVMFELGLRMAFQKPVVVVCDLETQFSFDIGVVRHIQYPRTLRYADILTFRDQLVAAIPAAVAEGNSYLKRFGPITSTPLGERTVGVEDLMSEIGDIRSLILETRNLRTHEIPWTTQSKSSDASVLQALIDANATYLEIVTTNKLRDFVTSYLSKHDLNFKASPRGIGQAVVYVTSPLSPRQIATIREDLKAMDRNITIKG